MQKQTVSITFIWLRIDFEQEVRKVPDTHVEVNPRSITQFFALCTDHKAKRKLPTTVT